MSKYLICKINELRRSLGINQPISTDFSWDPLLFTSWRLGLLQAMDCSGKQNYGNFQYLQFDPRS